MKWIIYLLIVWLVWRVVRRSPRDVPPTSARPAAERMVCCAYCKLNIPLAEAVAVRDVYFCSAEHKEAAAKKQRDAH